MELETSNEPQVALRVDSSRKKDKKKRKKRKGRKPGMLARALGKLVLGVTAAAKQMGVAMQDAGDKYRRKQDRSREKRRDGVIRDLGRNLASAASEYMEGSSKAPTKFAKALWKKNKRKKRKKHDRDDLRRVLAQPEAPTVSSS